MYREAREEPVKKMYHMWRGEHSEISDRIYLQKEIDKWKRKKSGEKRQYIVVNIG